MILIFLFILIAISSSKITFQSGLESTQITLKDVHTFSEVLVQAQFNHIDDHRYQTVHLVIRAVNRQKKQAYLDLLKRYNQLVRILIKLKAIPNKQSMIHSIIHRNFLRKSRKWEFYRYFIIYTHKDDVQRIKQYLKYFRLQVVKNSPAIQYLDQKFMSIAAFIQAKIQLQKFIAEHLNSEYRILKTKDIQIIGQKVQNEQIIEDHLQKQFNKRRQDREWREQDSGPSDTLEERGFYSKTYDYKPVKRVAIKVLFQLVEKSVDLQDLQSFIQEDEQQSESISDFEQEIENQKWKVGQNQEDQNQSEKNSDQL